MTTKTKSRPRAGRGGAAEIERAREKGGREAEVERQWGQANSEAAGRPLGSQKEDLEDEAEQQNSQFHKIDRPERGPYGDAGEQELNFDQQRDQWGRQDKSGGPAGEGAAGAKKKGLKKHAAPKKGR